MSKRRRQTPTRRELLATIDRLEKRIAELEAEVARPRKNSSTSSKLAHSDESDQPFRRKRIVRSAGKRSGIPWKAIACSVRSVRWVLSERSDAGVSTVVSVCTWLGRGMSNVCSFSHGFSFERDGVGVVD